MDSQQENKNTPIIIRDNYEYFEKFNLYVAKYPHVFNNRKMELKALLDKLIYSDKDIVKECNLIISSTENGYLAHVYATFPGVNGIIEMYDIFDRYLENMSLFPNGVKLVSAEDNFIGYKFSFVSYVESDKTLVNIKELKSGKVYEKIRIETLNIVENY